MKHIWIVTHKMTGGGCERVIAQLLQGFLAQGLSCTLVSECKVPSFYPLPEAVEQVFLLDSPEMAASDVPRAYGKLRKLALAQRPDVVVAMPEKVNVWCVLFLMFTGIPVVVSERNDPSRHPESKVKRLLRRLVYPFGAGFVFQTKQAAAYFSKAIQNRGTVIPNPLDPGRLPEINDGKRQQVVVGAGRLHEQKNFPLLIKAFAKFYQTHPQWRLVIYGQGPCRAALESLAQTLAPEVVELPGQTDQLPEQLATCGMFVLTSDYEGMPNVLMEALAVGAPCIATDCPVGGCAALVEDGQNGLLIPVGDEAALLAAMERLAAGEGLTQSPRERGEGIRARLDEEHICQAWITYLKAVVS